jgi:hypothetical protein
MNTKIWLDGEDFTGDTSGLDGFEVEYTLNDENKTVVKAISNTLTFEGDAYTYLKSIFIDDEAGGQDAIVNVIIEAGCCDKIYNFVINYELITYCPDECAIESALITQDARSLFYDALNSNVWFTDYNDIPFKDGLVFPRVRYGTDNLTQLIIFSALIIIVPFVILASTVINFIIDIVNTLPFENIPNFPIPTFPEAINGMVGGDNFHTTCYIRDIFERNCLQAGGTFSSTIFQSGVYNNTVLHCALTNGTHKDEHIGDTNFLDEESLHILTPIQLAELLKPVFNIDYRVLSDVNGNPVLKMERKDYFDEALTTIVNVDDEVKEGNAAGACYKFYDQSLPAFARYSYATDSLDVEGNRLLTTSLSDDPNKVSYFDLVEFNPGGQFKNRKGERTVTNEFGAARFQNDIKRRLVFDNIRQFVLGHEEMFIMERGTASNMKLLILKEFTFPDDAKVINRPSASDDGRRDYNWPLNFSEAYEENELIQNFHFIDHPDYAEGYKYIIDKWVWHPKNFCDAVNIVDANGIDLLVENDAGYAGRPDSITVMISEGTVIFKGIKMKKV